ncbi:F-box protein, partial [Endozoicomonas sp. ONNA2]|uniref:F-box protein n=1 Tax=Endozoicomonas sp. ONNA2 TaxID=2828741 RepID=UPI0021487901
MSDPLSATAVGFSMVPYWRQPAKTTPFNAPSTVTRPGASRQAHPPQIQPLQIQPLQQRKITELPPELLVMIFDYLEFDDIRQVNATCL